MNLPLNSFLSGAHAKKLGYVNLGNLIADS